MKKHSKNEKVNLEKLDFSSRQNPDLKSDYERLFKDDKKEDLLIDLLKVDFSHMDRYKDNSSDLELLGIHNTSLNSEIEANGVSGAGRGDRRLDVSAKVKSNIQEVSQNSFQDFKYDNNTANSRKSFRENLKINSRRESFEEVIRDNFDNRDQSGSSLLKDYEKIKDFNDLSYEVFNFQDLKNKIRKYAIRIKQGHKIDETMDSLKKLFTLWGNFQENLSIAKLRSISKNFFDQNYKYEYESRLASVTEVRREIFKATIALLDKNFLPELVKENGKLFFYKLNSFNLLYNLQNKIENSDLEKLESEFQEYLDESDLGEVFIRFVDLTIKRISFAKQLGFKDFYDFRRILNLDFNKDLGSLKEILNNIKTYIFPIYSINFDKCIDRFSAENENLLSDFYIDMDQDEFSQYYKNIFGEMDWELRNLNDVFTYINENKIHQEFFPQTKLAKTNLEGKSLVEALFYVSNRAIDRQSRGYLEALADLHYISSTGDSGEVNTNFLGTLPASKLFCMKLSVNNSMQSISDFLYLSGKAYSQLLRYNTKSSMHIFIEPSPESQHFIGTTMEMMATSRLDKLFDEDNFKKFRHWRMHKLLLEIINKCFLFDFELQFYELLSDATDIPFIDDVEYRLILDMLAKKTDALWDSLLQEYRLKHYYADKVFLKENVSKYLVEKPFSALKMTCAELASIIIMLEFNEDRAKARYDFEKFCAISGQSLFDEELELAGIDNPIDIDNLKSLAFAIVNTLEELETVESDPNQ